MCLSGFLAGPSGRCCLLSVCTCPGVTAEARAALSVAVGGQRAVGSPGLTLPCVPGALGGGWYSVTAPDLSRPWACWIAWKFPHLLPLAPWGLGIGAIWAPSFQWMVRDSGVTEEPPRAHHCLQEVGTLARLGGDRKGCARLASCPGVRVAAGHGLEVAQSPFWVRRHVAGGGRLPRHCPGRARGICVLETLALSRSV